MPDLINNPLRSLQSMFILTFVFGWRKVLLHAMNPISHINMIVTLCLTKISQSLWMFMSTAFCLPKKEIKKKTDNLPIEWASIDNCMVFESIYFLVFISLFWLFKSGHRGEKKRNEILKETVTYQNEIMMATDSFFRINAEQ